MPLKPSYLLLTGGGAIVAYSGIKGKGISSAVRSVIAGQSPANAINTAPITGPPPNAVTQFGGGGTGLPFGTAGGKGGGGSALANKALGMAMAASYGWIGQQWLYLLTGWEEESGWSTTAANQPSDPYNHAYGIPQANPGTKMASAGAGWRTSARVQIAWGLGYIKATYGSPMGVPNWSANGPLPGYVGY